MFIKRVMHSFNTAKSLIALSQGILFIITEASPKPHSILQFFLSMIRNCTTLVNEFAQVFTERLNFAKKY